MNRRIPATEPSKFRAQLIDGLSEMAVLMFNNNNNRANHWHENSIVEFCVDIGFERKKFCGTKDFPV